MASQHSSAGLPALVSIGTSGPRPILPSSSMLPMTHPSPTAYPRMKVSGRPCRKAMFQGEPPPPSWNEGAPSVPSRPTGNVMRPSGSGAFEAIDFGVPSGRRTQRSGVPSGFAWGRSSNVVPTRRNFSSGESTAMVATRSVLSCVFTVYRSGRAVRRPMIVHDDVPGLVRLHVEMSAMMIRHHHTHLFRHTHLCRHTYFSCSCDAATRNGRSTDRWLATMPPSSPPQTSPCFSCASSAQRSKMRTKLQPGLAVTAAVGDPLANVRRTITDFDSRVLATSKELDRTGVDASNLPAIQSHAAPRRFLTEETLQLGCCLFVDTAAHEIQDQWSCRSPPNLEHAACSGATPMPAAAPMVRSSGPNGDYER